MNKYNKAKLVTVAPMLALATGAGSLGLLSEEKSPETPPVALERALENDDAQSISRIETMASQILASLDGEKPQVPPETPTMDASAIADEIAPDIRQIVSGALKNASSIDLGGNTIDSIRKIVSEELYIDTNSLSDVILSKLRGELAGLRREVAKPTQTKYVRYNKASDPVPNPMVGRWQVIHDELMRRFGEKVVNTCMGARIRTDTSIGVMNAQIEKFANCFIGNVEKSLETVNGDSTTSLETKIKNLRIEREKQRNNDG